jgi:hypothetical protein
VNAGLEAPPAPSPTTQTAGEAAATRRVGGRVGGHARWRVGVVVALFAAAFVSSPLHLPLNNPNEGVRVFAARALVEFGTPAIDDVVRDWGYIDDKATRDGRLYSSKAPLVTLLGAAAYAVVRPWSGDLDRATLTRLCRLTGVVLPTALALAVAWAALARRLRDQTVVDLAMAGLVTGTGLLASLHVCAGHAVVAATAAALTALALLTDAPSTRRLVLVGGLVAVSACAEYPAILLGPLALPVLARAPRRRHAVAVMLGAATVIALPTLALHTASFGAPWRTGYSFLENAAYRPLVQGTLFGIGLPDPRVWVEALASPAVGLFFFAPACLVGALALPGVALRAPRTVAVVLVVVVAGFLAFIAGFRGWRGGWSVGPRYLSELWGVLVVVAASGADGDGRAGRALRALLPPAVAIGVVHSGLAGALFPHLPDVLANPVPELVLPLVVRGLAPDSVPLALGASPATSVVVIALAVAAPSLWAEAGRRPRARAAAGVPTMCAAVVFVVAVDGLLPGTAPAIRAVEVRRLVDNWRPEAGVPWLRDARSRDEGADARVLYAIDRGRQAPRPACAFSAPRPRTPDVGEGRRVLARADVPDAGLVVVSDALADAIAPWGGGALIVTLRDAAQHLRGPLPCEGDVVVVVRGTERVLLEPRGLRERGNARRDVGRGWVRRVYERGGATAATDGATR